MDITYVNINGIPTKVVSYGKTLEEITSSCEAEKIVLAIPGNPGITKFYYKFLQRVHKNLGYTVITLGHAGQDALEEDEQRKLPPLVGNEILYNLQGQITHKVLFVEQFIPKNAEVYLIGHSIGAYMSLQMLKNDSVKSKVVKCYLMFPTIEDLALTPNGKFFTSVICRVVWLLCCLAWLFMLLPQFLQMFIVNCISYFLMRGDNSLTNLHSLIDLFNPSVIQKVIFLAKDEMQIVKKRDSDTLEKNKGIIKLYYSADDCWAPVDYCNKLKKELPNINAEICTKGFMHSFVFDSSIEVADMISNWIKNS